MNSMLDSIEFFSTEACNLLSVNIPQIKRLISNGHSAIIILVSITILLSIVTIIRQQKIMKMLRDLTPPKAESPREEEASAKETE